MLENRFRSGGVVVLLVYAALGSSVYVQAQNSEKPNIIYIMADDLGYGDLGCYGQKVIQTPHIDRLASESLVFDNAFFPMAVCAPARTSMLTGKLPSEGSVICNNAMEFAVPYRDTSRERELETWGAFGAGSRLPRRTCRQVARHSSAGRLPL